MSSKYPLVAEAARHCWSHNFLDVFRDFYAQHAMLFLDAPQTISGEQNLEFYELYQRYLKLYEETLSSYIESLDVSVTEFYRQLADVKDDPTIKDKKLVKFVDYLVACTDYDSFYKVMVRAAKKQRAKLQARAESKADGKHDDDDDDDGDAKPSHKQEKDYKK